MSFASRHSKGSKFNVNTEGFEYMNLKNLYEEDPKAVWRIQGIYINKKSEYGDAPVAICDGFFANLPQHLLNECLEILSNEEDVNDIKAGNVGFTVYTYEKEDKKHKVETYYSINWEDVDE